MDGLQRLRDLDLPFARLIGVDYISVEKSRIVATMRVTAELCTSPAVLHGGALMAFADTLGAAGAILNLPEGAWTTTIESKTNFVAAAPVGSIVTGEATPVHIGRRTMIWQTRVSLADGKLAALVTQTQMVLAKT